MRKVSVNSVGFARAAAAVVVLGAAMPVAAVAGADAATDQLALDGLFQVTSNGVWSKTNDIYKDEPSLRSTWIVHSTCRSVQVCVGSVISNLGWTADMYWRTDRWVVRHEVPDWVKCPDGSRFPGEQVFSFGPVDGRGQFSPGSGVLAGEDTTRGVPGACGNGEPLVIRMPLRLDLIRGPGGPPS